MPATLGAKIFTVGSLMFTAGGSILLGQATPPAAVQVQVPAAPAPAPTVTVSPGTPDPVMTPAGYGAVIVGIASAVIGAVIQERAAARQERREGLKEKLDAALAKISTLEAGQGQIQANTDRGKQTEAKADLALQYLQRAGLIDPGVTTAALASVLIVEDDDGNAEAMKSVLRSRGFATERARDVAEASVLVDHMDFGCVLLDLSLPGDGGEVLLKRLREAGKTMRVAVVTALADGARVDAVRALAPDAILKKPFRLEQLIEAVRPGGSTA